MIHKALLFFFLLYSSWQVRNRYSYVYIFSCHLWFLLEWQYGLLFLLEMFDVLMMLELSELGSLPEDFTIGCNTHFMIHPFQSLPADFQGKLWPNRVTDEQTPSHASEALIMLLQMLGEIWAEDLIRQWCHDKVATKMMAMVMIMIAIAMRMTTKKTVATAVMIVMKTKMKMMVWASSDGVSEDHDDGDDWVFRMPGLVTSSSEVSLHSSHPTRDLFTSHSSSCIEVNWGLELTCPRSYKWQLVKGEVWT